MNKTLRLYPKNLFFQWKEEDSQSNASLMVLALYQMANFSAVIITNSTDGRRLVTKSAGKDTIKSLEFQ